MNKKAGPVCGSVCEGTGSGNLARLCGLPGDGPCTAEAASQGVEGTRPPVRVEEEQAFVRDG